MWEIAFSPSRPEDIIVTVSILAVITSEFLLRYLVSLCFDVLHLFVAEKHRLMVTPSRWYFTPLDWVNDIPHPVYFLFRCMKKGLQGAGMSG